MRNLFFDTSALVKRYYDERGTDTVDTLVDDLLAAFFEKALSEFPIVPTEGDFRSLVRSRSR